MSRSARFAEGVQTDGASNTAFRAQVQDSLDRFPLNHVSYPANLSVGSDPVIHNPLAGLKSNLVVVMLVRTEYNRNTTGMTRVVDSLHVNVAFGSRHPRIRARIRLPGGRIHLGTQNRGGSGKPRRAKRLHVVKPYFRQALVSRLVGTSQPVGPIPENGVRRGAVPRRGMVVARGRR